MELKLVRDQIGAACTLGQLYIDGRFECYTLEDQVRMGGEKVWGETAIPEGTYQVIINSSPRFKRDLPRLIDVPGFEGVLIHPGNTTADTAGCILVGRARDLIECRIMESRLAFEPLFAKLQAALQEDGRVNLEVTSL